MAKRLDLALVIDVESTCWDGPPPMGQVSEIIEIGLCTVDLASLERREKRSLMVRPQRSEIGPFCTELTSITPDMVVRAGVLEEACEILKREYYSHERLFASWGDYDRGQFQRNCQMYGLGYPFGPTHLNVKSLFATALGMSRECGLDAACEKMGLPLEGVHHRGVDDAWNIAQLYCLLMKRIRRAGIVT
jgi:inhibitor of KinA sporulation pathway (predicted exonuclease)